MRIRTLAKMFAKFRIKFRTVEGEKLREKQLVKYYTSLIKLNQAFPLFNEDGILIALCEVWKMKEEDIPLFKETKIPKSIADGDVIFVAGATMDPNFKNTGIYRFWRKFLREHIYKGQKIFWYTKRKRFTKIFGK